MNRTHHTIYAGTVAIYRRLCNKKRHLLDVYFWEKFFGEFLMPHWVHGRYRFKKKAPPDPVKVQSVLVWNLDSLGDALWITPTLRALKTGYPHARITLVCNQKIQEIFQFNPFVDELIGVLAEQFYSARGFLKKVSELDRRTFDVMVILEAGSRPADRGRLLGRQLKVGYLVSTQVGLFKSLCDEVLPPNTGIKREYWPQYFMKVTSFLNISSAPIKLEVFRGAEDLEKSEKVFKAPNPRVTSSTQVMIHPCVAPYARLTKKWPSEYFITLILELREHLGADVYLTGSNDEVHECDRLVAEVSKRAGKNLKGSVQSLAGKFSVRELVVFLEKMDLLVTADTAVLHLAEVTQTPVIALFGATDPQVLTSKRQTLVALTENLPCRPCHQTQDRAPFWPKCIFESPRCLEGIQPARVLKEAQRLISMASSQEKVSP